MITDFLNDVSWLAIGAAVVAAFVVGLVWFSPAAAGGFWARQVARYTAVSEGEITAGASQAVPLSRWVVAIAANAVVLGLAVEAVNADSVGEGVLLGLILGIGIGATLSSWPAIFARMPWEWWLVNSVAFLLMQAAMGAILGAWR